MEIRLTTVTGETHESVQGGTQRGPEMHFGAGYQVGSRAEWETLKRLGDAAWNEFEAKFGGWSGPGVRP